MVKYIINPLFIAYTYLSLITLTAKNRNEMIFVIYLFTLNFVIRNFALDLYKRKLYIAITLFLVGSPLYLKWLLLANTTLFLCLSLVLFFIFFIRLGNALENKILLKSKQMFVQLYLLLGKIILWGIGAVISEYLIIFVITQLISSIVPKGDLTEVIKRGDVINLFIIITISLLATYFIFRFLSIVHKSIQNIDKETHRIQAIIMGATIFILVILPDFVFSFIYLAFAFTTEQQSELGQFMGVVRTFYFTFSLHYSLPISDETFSSVILEKIVNNHELKYIQFGHIIISKIFDLIAIAIVADYIKNRFFVEKVKV
ncbi:hypothetical protein ACFQ88_23455 [Paenibacillus sp. NPDC056579]|uniref:hypothetical protein n=1 Tax=Paenibacillus sp. NPDC056579 TaxID=3345871 RepID=UPI0036CBD000